MKMAVATLMLLAFSGAVSAARITPVQKVIQMMNEMKAKGQKMAEEEAAIYREYTNWVDDRQTDLGFDIKTSTSKIEELTAFIEKAEADIAALGEAIQKLDDDIARLESEKAEATKIRKADNAEYQEVSTDYGESVDALERAIQTLTQQAHSTPQAEMLLQRMAKTTRGMTRVLAAYAEAQGDSEPGAPEVAGYKTQSGGIIEVLEGLFKKFKMELDEVNEEEANKKHAYDLTMIHLGDTITKSKSDRGEKAKTKAETTEASKKAQADLANEKKAKKEDETLLADITATFEDKTSAFKANQQVRKEELEALNKAIEIISSPDVADSYKENINLAQVSSQSISLLQLSSKRREVARKRVTEFLKNKAGQLRSQNLAKLAEQAAANPFGKVITMIEELLAKLKEEAAAEADHKKWCDQELKANKLKRDKKTTKVNELKATVEDLTSTIETLGEEIKALAKKQSDLTTAMNEASAARAKESAENKDTIADAAAGNKAVKAALVVLREFYDKQAALLQRQAPEMEEYKGMSGGGIVGMLEVIETDFMRLESETKAAEAQAAAEHEKFMEDAKADKEAAHKREVKARLEKDQTEFDKSEVKKDLETTEEELGKANEYYEYLKPNCIEIHVSYEERVAARKAEIKALQEAYQILDEK